MHKIVDGKKVELSAQEVAQRQAEEKAWQSGAFDRAMADLRQRRNRLLTATDWTILTDVPLEPADKSKMMQYRSTLRNITNGLKTVEDVNAVKLPGIPVL